MSKDLFAKKEVVDPAISAAADAALNEADGFKKPPVKTATSKEIDLNDLDETTLLKYNIEGKTLNDPAAMLLKPKESAIIFRWVYFDNKQAGAKNLKVFKHKGFQFATVEDVEGGEDALTEGIIDDGGKIINYDTVLMKINKLRLMQHYKASLMRSLEMVDAALLKAAKGAKQEITQTSAYQKAMSTHPKATVDFYQTGG